jgi:hypothetical protein
MKINVVYILGAGFSAPAGIPVMRDFIDRGRQIKRGIPKYDYFEKVIKLIQDTVSAEKYFQHDSANIEEALSLLEMRDNLEGGNTKQELINFIVDVIKVSTPKPPEFRFGQMPSKTWVDLFTKDQNWQGYCAFVSSLSCLEFFEGTNFEMRGIKVRRTASDTQYSILSLNYDLMLENTCQYLSNSYWWGDNPPIQFDKQHSNDSQQNWPRLVKIHGSIDTTEIIPPTFNKGLYGSSLPQSWRDAYDILVKANEIRVLGYSLPQTDSYIKYLLMASIDKFKDLDRIDWIALDSNGKLHERLDQFITFRNKRFCNFDLGNYLGSIFGHAVNASQIIGNDKVSFTFLEQMHDEFMQNHSNKTA